MKSLWGVVIILLVALGGFVFGVSSLLPIQNEPRPADIIVAISGGDTGARANRAIELYQQGLAPQLIFSGAAKDPGSPSNAQVMKELALSRGVPPEAIILDELSRNTKENATKSQKLIGNHKNVLLVTSEYHQRRAQRAFEKALGPDVTLTTIAVRDKNWHPASWWLTPYGWWITLSELLGLIFNS